MPKKTRKEQRSLADVTLNDFANSSVPKNRSKKSSNNVNVVLKKEVEKSWDEKDVEDFSGEFFPEENEDGTISYVIRKTEPRTPRKTLLRTEDYNSKSLPGKEYHIDIWYLLSNYIKPEDVGTFAAICKTSFEVVCSARFWFGLYRRYYKTVPGMPEPLQPENLIRKYGLRKNVIRALFHMYQPFVDRIKLNSTIEEHPELLINYDCQVFWYTTKDTKSKYIYYFKMKQKTMHSKAHSRAGSRLPDLLEILDDVSANPDEHHRVLRVSCLYFNNIPPVIGLTLKSVSLTHSLTGKFRYHRLQLCFGSGTSWCRLNSRGGADYKTVILDQIINIRVLDWWHPLYPAFYNMEELLQCRD